MEKICGIDVSRWQGDINWPEVKNSDAKFAMIKAGGSDDGFYTDSKFERNYANAKANNIPVGAYYFVGPGFLSAEDGVADAKRFLEIIKNKTFEMPIALDLESTRIEDKENATDAAIAFCETLEDAGYYVIIYGSDIYGFKDRMNIDRLKDYDKWVARYGSEPKYVSDYGMWQYSSTGSVSGINGNVDMNIARKDYPTIITSAGLNGFSSDVNNDVEVEKPNESEKPEEESDDKEITYTIKSGDTLSGIASKFNTTVSKLVELNNIKNPNLIITGDKLVIRSGSVENNEPTTYTIKSGDNLTKIAKKFGTTVSKLVELNNIKNPNLIITGDKLKIN